LLLLRPGLLGCIRKPAVGQTEEAQNSLTGRLPPEKRIVPTAWPPRLKSSIFGHAITPSGPAQMW